MSGEEQRDYSVRITPVRLNDEEKLRVTIEAPEGSAFVLKQKLELAMPDRSVVYIASQKLLAGEKQLYLFLKIETGEAEE